MKYGPENSVLTNEGDMDKFIGIEITQLDEKIFKISQPYMIDRIIKFLGTDKNNTVWRKMLSQHLLASHFCIYTYLLNHAKKVGITEHQSVC